MSSAPSARQEGGKLSAEVLADITETLRRRERFELAGYRPAYARRRIITRLHATHESPESYARRLQTDGRERRVLVEALGVNVTSFFRDPSVWLFLEEVALPPLFDEKTAGGGTFRALSLGCAGGQEAYSLAMLLAELAHGHLDTFLVEAWDMDEPALDAAREAWYPKASVESLTPSAVARYFVPEAEGYRVNDALRARVSVRRRDMLWEGLAGTFDLILLRNVLIYFDQEAKTALLRRAHASLSERGLLVLGQSETLAATDFFRPLSLRNRVYAGV